MFDFEKLFVYKKAKIFNQNVLVFIRRTKIDSTAKSQLRRAALSIVLNIAEGSGRNSDADKRHFYVMARGSVFECVALFDLFKDEKIIDTKEFGTFYASAEEISKMLFSMIRGLE